MKRSLILAGGGMKVGWQAGVMQVLLDEANIKDFRSIIAPILKTHTRIVLDLGSLRFIDSAGLAAVLHCLKQLNTQGGDLKLCGLSRSVRTLFELVRMNRIFVTFDTREEAVRAVLWQCPWKLLHIVLQPEDRIHHISDALKV